MKHSCLACVLKIAEQSLTINSEIFARILFAQIALKDIFGTLKLVTRAWFTYISRRKSDFTIMRGVYFREISQVSQN